MDYEKELAKQNSKITEAIVVISDVKATIRCEIAELGKRIKYLRKIHG
jgi:hypothetical protein